MVRTTFYAAGGSYEKFSQGVSTRTPPRWRESMRAACAPCGEEAALDGVLGLACQEHLVNGEAPALPNDS